MADNDAPQGANTETDSQDKTDWKAEARKWEARAKESFTKAQANEEAAKKLAALEDAKKSDDQKWQERVEKLEQELSGSKLASDRARIQARYGLSDEDADLFLTASDAEQLEAQAKALSDRIKANKKSGPTAPEQKGKPSEGGSDPLRELARQVFDND